MSSERKIARNFVMYYSLPVASTPNKSATSAFFSAKIIGDTEVSLNHTTVANLPYYS